MLLGFLSQLSDPNKNLDDSKEMVVIQQILNVLPSWEFDVQNVK